MVEDNKKIITVSFVFTAILLAFVIHFLLTFLAQNFAFAARIESSDALSTGIPVVIGAILFGFLQFNSHTVDFTDGVVGELKKVVWPSRKDTGVMTVVVSIMLIISGVVIGVFDAIWAYLIHMFVR